MQHLCQSKFIASFDEVDRKTKEYKRDIAEADILTEVNKQYQTENMVLSAVVEGLTEENERLSKEFVEYIKTAPIVKIDEGVISEFAIKRAIRNYELHFGKSAKLDQIAKEMLEGE
jgi:hypothetical protein